LGTLNFIIAVLLVVKSNQKNGIKEGNLPVLVKPVINLSLSIKRISEIARSGGSNPEHGPVCAQDIVRELLVPALIVLLENAKVTSRLA